MDFAEHLKKYLNDDEINSLINSLKRERTYSLILNASKINPSEFEQKYPNLKKHDFLKNVYYFDKTKDFGKNYLFDNGAYYIMDASSMLSSYFLNPNENDLIFDMCAAPGGKSIFASLNFKNVEILSNDISHERCLKMSSIIEGLGLSNITIINYDFLKNTSILNNTFDKIILDAPCSESAMFRKDDKFFLDWSYQKVLKCAEIQKNLILRAFDMLKPGGEIIYSTCSFSYEENEEVIDYLLKNRLDARLITLPNNDCFFRSKDFPETIHLFPFKYKGEGQYVAKILKQGICKPNVFNSKIEKNNYSIITKYKLNFNYYYKNNNFLFGTNLPLQLKNIPIIKRGLKILDYKNNIEIPSFHLAHYLSSSFSIPLNDEEAKKYIHGEEIKKRLNLENGFYVVSFNNLNLGFIKYTNGVLKNYYPKGLRH